MATSLTGPLPGSAFSAAPVPRPPQPTRASWMVLFSAAWTGGRATPASTLAPPRNRRREVTVEVFSLIVSPARCGEETILLDPAAGQAYSALGAQAYTVPSKVVTKILPAPTARPEKWVQPVMDLPLLYTSWPVWASNAYRTAVPWAVSMRSLELRMRPAESSWRTFSPLERARTRPLTTTGGSGTSRSRDTQAGVSVGAPSLVSTFQAMMLPLVT